MTSQPRALLFVAIIAIGFVAGTQRGFGQTAAPSESRAIASALNEQVADWNRGDIPAFMRGYWKSGDTEFVNDAGILKGWDDVLRRYEKSYPNRAAMGHLTFSGLEIHVLCPDSAYVIGKYRLDREKDHPEGVFTLIFRKFGDGWKIVNDHTTAFRATK